MNEPSTDDRLIGQLAATLRELPDDELARGLQAPIDPGLRERLFEMMESSRVGAPVPVQAANDAGWRWVIGVMLAAAAAVALWVGGRERPPEPDEAPLMAIAPLTDYKLEVDGGLATQRSHNDPPEGELRYRSNNEFNWVMRPDENVAAAVSARLCVRMESKEVEIDIGPFVTSDESGAVRLHGEVAALNLSPGHWTAVIAVGYPEVLSQVASVCRASTSAGMHVQRFDMQLLSD